MRIINIDISDLYRTRGRTGIQRVVREVSSRLLTNTVHDYRVRVIRFDYTEHRYMVIEESSALAFLKERAQKLDDPINESYLALDDFGENDIFLDIDSAWNSPLKRPALYKRLKASGATIITLVYDMLPVQFPHLAHPETLRTWSLFIGAVFTYTDVVLLISRDSETEFLRYQELVGETRHIPTVVIRCGADFSVHESPSPEELAATNQFRSSEYILMVGTIEPRKMHMTAIKALEIIHATRPDVHLVFAGRLGWHSRETHNAIVRHPLFNVRVHWIEGPEDGLLEALYEGAAMTLYLSHGEGYGLPVAESLGRGKITITSSNSSIYEVGTGFADYVHFNTATEAAETALAYLASPVLRERRLQQIAEKFRPVRWDTVVGAISRLIDNLDTAKRLLATPVPESVQWLSISNVPASLARTIPLIDERVSWVKEFLIVGPESQREEITAIPSRHPIRFVPEESVLGDMMEEFRAGDHMFKNWTLRTLVAQRPELDEEFVMFDDDNVPGVEIEKSVFFGDTYRYVGYYFYDMPRWPHRKSPYDFGLHTARELLTAEGLEVLAYSAHQPQVFNKTLFGEVIELFTRIGAGKGIDEWSAYFDYVASRYPTLLSKQVFQSLSWPDGPWTWEHQYRPLVSRFENYYPGAYKDGSHSAMREEMTHEEKVALKRSQEAPYLHSLALYKKSEPILASLEMAHGAMVFDANDTQLVVAGVPHVITVAQGAPVRLKLTFARLGKESSGHAVQFCYRVGGEPISYGMSVEDQRMPDAIAGNGVIHLTMPSEPLAPGVYDIDFFAKIDGEIHFTENVSYRSRLVVCAPEESVPQVYERL
jgi:glycosyltransferase involved in cell wall biosynthesis